uniref:Uncharacterized protein n=1 Tax=Oryza glumipatula TaxID=40148 RepID=A0A0D9YRC7_9ORYZ
MAPMRLWWREAPAGGGRGNLLPCGRKIRVWAEGRGRGGVGASQEWGGRERGDGGGAALCWGVGAGPRWGGIARRRSGPFDMNMSR